jgi:hypothetical protein
MVANPSYYPHDYADEVLPGDLKELSLAGWAEWLSQGGDKAGEDGGGWQTKVPSDGQQFKAIETVWLDDVTAAMNADGEITFEPHLPDDYDFLAFRFGPGMGWSPDDIIYPVENPVEAIKVQELLSPGDDGLLAVGKSREVMLTYRADPPRLVIAGSVQ